MDCIDMKKYENDYDNEDGNHTEELPFALSETCHKQECHKTPFSFSSPTVPLMTSMVSHIGAGESCAASFQTSSLSASTLPPPLASSTVSIPTVGEESQTSNMMLHSGSEDHLGASSCSYPANSHFLDAAASLLLPTSSFFGSFLPSSQNLAALDSSQHTDTGRAQQKDMRQGSSALPSSPAVDQSMAFSVLFRQAGDTEDSLPSSRKKLPTSTMKQMSLPVLPEESISSMAQIDYICSSSSFFQDEKLHNSRLGTGPISQQRELTTSVVQSSQSPSSSQTTSVFDWIVTSPNSQASAFPSSNHITFHNPMETIIPPASSVTSSHHNSFFSAAASPSDSVYRSNERRLASLAGASACRTASHSFTVTVEILAIDSCSVQDVMDIVGNPDLLKLWFDPIHDLVITRSSEGALTEASRLRHPQLTNTTLSTSSTGNGHTSTHSSSLRPKREYDGEWIEATTTQLMAPNTSCFYSTSRSVSAALGFPTYGKVSMFVERQRGQVGLTVGPFPGNMEVIHKIKVQQVDSNNSSVSNSNSLQRIRIVDDMRIQKDLSGEDDDIALCGVFDVFQNLLLPTVDDYVDQMLSSMARLRFLIENGEKSMYVDAPATDVINVTASTPLLT